jgi:hypothetical protein
MQLSRHFPTHDEPHTLGRNKRRMVSLHGRYPHNGRRSRKRTTQVLQILKTHDLIGVQLQTSKVIKFGISRTRIFWLKLMTDSDSGGQIKLKYILYIKFPRGFGCAKFLGKIFPSICHMGQQPMPNSVSLSVSHRPDRSRLNKIMPRSPNVIHNLKIKDMDQYS